MEGPPVELAGVADQVTVVLPWGSLLAAIAIPRPEVLRGIRAICQPGARLTVVLGSDPARDGAELRRLGISSLAPSSLASRLAFGYAGAGFTLGAVRGVEPSRLARWPSTWAARLARGAGRAFVELEAVAGSAGGRAG